MSKALKEKLKCIVARNRKFLIIILMIILFSFVVVKDTFMPRLTSLVISSSYISDDFTDGDMDEYAIYLSRNDENQQEVTWWIETEYFLVVGEGDYPISDCGVATFVLELAQPMLISGFMIDAIIMSHGYEYTDPLERNPPTYGSVFFEFLLSNGTSFMVWFYGNFTYVGSCDDGSYDYVLTKGAPATQSPHLLARIPFDAPGNISYAGEFTGYHVNSGVMQLSGSIVEVRIHITTDDGYPNEGWDQLAIGLDYYNITFLPEIEITNPSEGEVINISKARISWVYSGSLDHFEVSVDYGMPIDVGMNTSYITEPLLDGEHTVIVRMYDVNGNIVEDNVTFTVDTVDVNISQSVEPSGFNITLRFGVPLENNTFDIKLYCQGYEPQTTADLDPQYAYWFRYYANTSAIQNLGSHGFAEFKEKYVDSGSGLYYDTILVSLENISWAGTWEIKVIPSPYGYTKTKTFTVNAYIGVSLDRTTIYYSIVPTTNNTVVPIGYFSVNVTANTKFALYIRASGNAIGQNTSWEIPIEYFYFDTDGTWDGNEVSLNTSNIFVAQVVSPPYYNQVFTIYLYWRVILPIPDDTYYFTLYIVVEVL